MIRRTLKGLSFLSLLIFSVNIHANSGITQMKIVKGGLQKNVKSVAIVSIHGKALIGGRNIKTQPLLAFKNKNNPEDKISKTVEELVLKLDNLVTNANYYPFDFIGRQQVLKSKAYETLIANNARYAAPSMSLASLVKNAAKQETDFSSAYFMPNGYKVYILPPKEVVYIAGTTRKEQEALFAQLGGADALLTASVEFSFYDKGLMMKGGLISSLTGGGVAKGVCKVTIKIGMEMASGKQVLVAESWAESDKNWLFRNIEKNATIMDKEIPNAIEMANQAFDSAWGQLESKLAPKLAKLQK